jgi:hypothetical protein
MPDWLATVLATCFLTAMNEVTGDVEQAIAASSKVLAVQGQVLPSTLSDVKLWAQLSDGRRIEGESKITEAKGRIVTIGCTPADPPALPRALKAIREAALHRHWPRQPLHQHHPQPAGAEHRRRDRPAGGAQHLCVQCDDGTRRNGRLYGV